MSDFETIAIVDWSARSAPSPARPSADAIWIAVARRNEVECHYMRRRSDAMAFLSQVAEGVIRGGKRILIGFDFPFGYPRGFAARVSGSGDPLALWRSLHERIRDRADNANNRFAVAADLNRLFPGIGPFWGCPKGQGCDDLPEKGSARRAHGLPERRQVETIVRRAQPCWKLYTTGSVGSQALLGIAHLQRLRERFGPKIAVSPFEPPNAPIVLAEVFPSLLADSIKERQHPDEIKDRAQVRVMAGALQNLPPDRLTAMLQEGDPEEGWILGATHQQELIAACP